MRHIWAQNAGPSDTTTLPPPLCHPVDADRRQAGPYTVASELLDALVPDALTRWPGLVSEHDIEIRAAAPRLREKVPARRQTIAATLPSPERILVPPPQRTLRIANGLAEFIREHLIRAGSVGRSLVATHVHEADHTDQEFLAVLIRRLDPHLLTIMVCAPPASPAPVLQAALERHADVTAGSATQAKPPAEEPVDPVAARETVMGYLAEGFHHAVAELGTKARVHADSERDPDVWWRLTHSTATALTAIEREDEARALFDDVRLRSIDPEHHASAAYSTGMLYVRHHDPAQHDLNSALRWVNEAIAISTLLPERELRAFKLGFDLNARALIEMRLGRTAEALRLVEEATELADGDLPPDRHPIHRLVLRGNRAQLLARLGRPEEALKDLDVVIAADPQYPDYYIDRGNLLHGLGRWDDAVADYETAMRVGPPFSEPYYNRSEIRFARGDHKGALADLDHVLELDPDFAAAYVNRAGLLAALEDYDGARRDVTEGLRLDSGNAHLLCVLGQVELAEGRTAAALEAFDAALERDDSLAAAWAIRGILAFDSGDIEASIAHLTRAIQLDEHPEFLRNRAQVLQAAGRDTESAADIERADALEA